MFIREIGKLMELIRGMFIEITIFYLDINSVGDMLSENANDPMKELNDICMNKKNE